MYDDRRLVGRFVHSGIAKTQPSETVGLSNPPHLPIAQRFDGVIFQPAVIVEREDDDDLGAFGFLQTAAQCVGDQRARQVLVLDVEEAARRRYEIEVESFDFTARHERIRTRNHDIYVGHVCADIFWPGVAVRSRLRAEVPCRSMPAFANDFSESCGRIAVDHRLHVMGRRISAARVLRVVLGGIPAAAGDVHASRECELPVDDDNFLMMAPTRGMDIVGLEMDARVFERVLAVRELRVTNVGEEDREVPRQNINVQVGIVRHEVQDELSERARGVCGLMLNEMRSRIEVPCEERDPSLRSSHGFRESVIVGCAIDKQGKPFCCLDAPAIAPSLHNAGHSSFLSGGSLAKRDSTECLTHTPVLAAMPERRKLPRSKTRSAAFEGRAQAQIRNRKSAWVRPTSGLPVIQVRRALGSSVRPRAPAAMRMESARVAQPVAALSL
jgi:hypothetical protein